MGAYRIQRRIGRLWVSRLCCAIGVLGFVAFAALFAYISYGTKSFADALRNPRPALQVPANWAPNMSAPDRTKYSRYFAQAAFRERGELLKYIDGSGRLVDFMPTAEDRLERAQYLQAIQTQDRQARNAAIAAAFSLLFLLCAFSLARTGLAAWLYGLESRIEAWRRRN